MDLLLTAVAFYRAPSARHWGSELCSRLILTGMLAHPPGIDGTPAMGWALYSVFTLSR